MIFCSVHCCCCFSFFFVCFFSVSFRQQPGADWCRQSEANECSLWHNPSRIFEAEEDVRTNILSFSFFFFFQVWHNLITVRRAMLRWPVGLKHGQLLLASILVDQPRISFPGNWDLSGTGRLPLWAFAHSMNSPLEIYVQFLWTAAVCG